MLSLKGFHKKEKKKTESKIRTLDMLLSRSRLSRLEKDSHDDTEDNGVQSRSTVTVLRNVHCIIMERPRQAACDTSTQSKNGTSLMPSKIQECGWRRRTCRLGVHHRLQIAFESSLGFQLIFHLC